MKKTTLILALAFVLACFWGAAVQAADPDFEAVVKLVDRATDYAKEKGRDVAFADFVDPAKGWMENGLYIFALDFNGNMLCHPNAKLVGKNHMQLKDVNGKAFNAETISAAKSEKGEGWVDYFWPKPNEKTPSPKVSFVKRVPGEDYLLGVGIYDATKEEAEKATGR